MDTRGHEEETKKCFEEAEKTKKTLKKLQKNRKNWKSKYPKKKNLLRHKCECNLWTLVHALLRRQQHDCTQKCLVRREKFARWSFVFFWSEGCVALLGANDHMADAGLATPACLKDDTGCLVDGTSNVKLGVLNCIKMLGFPGISCIYEVFKVFLMVVWSARAPRGCSTSFYRPIFFFQGYFSFLTASTSVFTASVKFMFYVSPAINALNTRTFSQEYELS